MKKKIKYIFILMCTLVAIIGNSITVLADNTYTYTVEYSMSNGVRFRYIFTTTLSNCVLVKDSVRYGQYAYGYVNGEAVDITGSVYLVGKMIGYVDRENSGNFTYLTESEKISMPYSYNVTGIKVYDSLEDYVSYMRENEPKEPPTEEPSTEEASTEEPSTEEPSTEEPSTEEPSTEEPSTEEPPIDQPTEPPTDEPTIKPTTPPSDDSDMENIDYGIAGNVVSDLIGNCKEFTPQSVMAIFVICLALECLSHIVSALLSVGGMK